MKIGFVRQESLKVKEQDGATKEIKYLECYFRMAGVISFQVKMSKNKDQDTTKKQPDYNLYMRTNLNKYDTFRDIPIGALWMGSTLKDGETLNFMTGYIESPLFGRLNIAVWKAKPNYEGEVVRYLYDINTMEDKQNENDNNSYQQYQEPQAQMQDSEMPTIDIDNDEIPF